MSEPATPRQVLYALVAAGFLAVVATLTIGAAMAGLVPAWWTAALAVALAAVGLYTAVAWRQTGRVLALAIGLFIAWMVGTLMLAS